jgi:hypothetical protein
MQTGRRMMKAFTFLCAAACLCLFAGCKQEKSAPAAATNNASGNPLTAPADYVGALGQAKKSAEKRLGAVGLDQAIKVFVAEEGRYPNTLDELVSKGKISSIPNPPAGMKYDYDAKTGTIKVVPQ